MSRFRPDDASALIRTTCADTGLTQVELARRASLRQPSPTQMGSGARPVSERMLERVLCAADYYPSVPLSAHADEITERARAHGLEALWAFGSMVCGEDGFDSDTGLMVTSPTETNLLDLALLIHEIEEFTGFPTDMASDTNVPTMLANAVREMAPL